MIKSIGHIAFGVKDIDKSLEFHCGGNRFQRNGSAVKSE